MSKFYLTYRTPEDKLPEYDTLYLLSSHHSVILTDVVQNQNEPVGTLFFNGKKFMGEERDICIKTFYHFCEDYRTSKDGKARCPDNNLNLTTQDMYDVIHWSDDRTFLPTKYGWSPPLCICPPEQGFSVEDCRQLLKKYRQTQ